MFRTGRDGTKKKGKESAYLSGFANTFDGEREGGLKDVAQGAYANGERGQN
jgi:hypothetical protein